MEKSRKSAILNGQRVVGVIRLLIGDYSVGETRSVHQTNQICLHLGPNEQDLSPKVVVHHPPSAIITPPMRIRLRDSLKTSEGDWYEGKLTRHNHFDALAHIDDALNRVPVEFTDED
ncbi:hypothetical protein Ddye_001589 [Dipteronia dyeriana]|uniref:Uncharacterized protein n=1 Tax=Dipteronia dyeriana TaxID=168575 RepID=A0AAD9XP63_9ROSI|nr:hypothetical protein Ddye_001589 [Dipteronia dyeriana]